MSNVYIVYGRVMNFVVDELRGHWTVGVCYDESLATEIVAQLNSIATKLNQVIQRSGYGIAKAKQSAFEELLEEILEVDEDFQPQDVNYFSEEEEIVYFLVESKVIIPR